jgi:hypothetical protein
MRLYDKMLTQAPPNVREGMRSRAHETTVITCDAVAAHYADSDEMEWGPDKFPHARPPWDVCWVEFRSPPTVKLNDRLEPQPKNEGGVFCVARPLTRELRKSLPRGRSAIELEEWREASLQKGIAEATILVVAQPATYIFGRLMIPQAHGYWFLNDDGFILGWYMYGDDPHFDLMVKMADLQGTSFGSEWFHIAWLCFSFCHCKNVSLVDVTEELQPEPKIRRRLKLPEVRRYTLNIGGHIDRPRRDFDHGGASVMPFHLCRGHFATYTADKPMFGNPKLVGRYWHPPHTRGKKENGEVIKDYRVFSPQEKASA